MNSVILRLERIEKLGWLLSIATGLCGLSISIVDRLPQTSVNGILSISDSESLGVILLVAAAIGLAVVIYSRTGTGETTSSNQKQTVVGSVRQTPDIAHFVSTAPIGGPKEDKKIAREKVRIRTKDYAYYKIRLEKGEKVTGTISSTGFFDVYFFTESSFRSFDDGEEARELDGSADISYYEPNFCAVRSGTYFTVIENHDTKTIVVDVRLFAAIPTHAV